MDDQEEAINIMNELLKCVDGKNAKHAIPALSFAILAIIDSNDDLSFQDKIDIVDDIYRGMKDYMREAYIKKQGEKTE